MWRDLSIEQLFAADVQIRASPASRGFRGFIGQLTESNSFENCFLRFRPKRNMDSLLSVLYERILSDPCRGLPNELVNESESAAFVEP
jgi:hypothetical protein